LHQIFVSGAARQVSCSSGRPARSDYNIQLILNLEPQMPLSLSKPLADVGMLPDGCVKTT
jgi:hypothetical protein